MHFFFFYLFGFAPSCKIGKNNLRSRMLLSFSRDLQRITPSSWEYWQSRIVSKWPKTDNLKLVVVPGNAYLLSGSHFLLSCNAWFSSWWWTTSSPLFLLSGHWIPISLPLSAYSRLQNHGPATSLLPLGEKQPHYLTISQVLILPRDPSLLIH